MEYLALYRKYRPKNFDEVIGQDHITKTLINQVKTKQIGHAYLFTGSRGTGKTSCAKIMAKAINCLNPVNGSPCGKCDCCKALSEENNVDVFEIDAASNNGVNEIRELREKIKYPPINCKYKVYIIDEVHMLTDSAFNALLKTLEEPPKHAVFILATTEVHKLPATILSRCMRFDFKLVSVEQLVEHLKNVFNLQGIKYDDRAVELIANAGEGSVRDSLSIADCVVAYGGGKVDYDNAILVLGLSDKEIVYSLAQKIIDKDMGGILEDINVAYNSGKNLIVLAKELTVHFKNLLVIKTCNDGQSMLKQTREIFEKWEAQARLVDSKKLLSYMQKFSAIESDLKYVLSPRLLVEITALECASLDSKN